VGDDLHKQGNYAGQRVLDTNGRPRWKCTSPPSRPQLRTSIEIDW